jgi:hypothetical protein
LPIPSKTVWQNRVNRGRLSIRWVLYFFKSVNGLNFAQTRLPGIFLGDEASSRKRSRRDLDDGDEAGGDVNAEGQVELPTTSEPNMIISGDFF